MKRNQKFVWERVRSFLYMIIQDLVLVLVLVLVSINQFSFHKIHTFSLFHLQFIVIHHSSGLSAALYILIGTLGALSLPNVSENMLSSMITGEYGIWTQIGSSTFAFFIIGLGIPLFSVIMRLNLTGSGICSQRMGNFLAVILPWSVSWIVYKSSVTTKLLSWGGILFTSIIAFIAPLLLSYVAIFESESRGYIPVWGSWKCFTSRKGEAYALLALVILAIICILLSITGEFI